MGLYVILDTQYIDSTFGCLITGAMFTKISQ